MFDFLKTVGTGLLFLILSPIIVAGVLLYAVYALGLFFFMFIKRIVLFFKGEDMKTAMRYDEVAQIHLNNQDEEALKEKEVVPSTVVQQNTTNNNTTIEKTTLVQPIIIQTDEEGRLKDIKYINPTQMEQAKETSQSSYEQVFDDEKEAPLIENSVKEEE